MGKSKTAENNEGGTALVAPPNGPRPLATGQDLVNLLEASQFMVVRPSSDIREAIEANSQSGDQLNEQDLTRVKLPSGGGSNWTINDVEGETMSPEITGLLVYCGVRGVLWPYEEIGENRPVMISHDLQLATLTGALGDVDLGDLDPKELEKAHVEGRIYDWTKLSYNGWGTSSKGKGKRAKESRVICILRPGDAYPLLINVPAGSLKTVTPFVKKLPVPHFRAIVQLKLESLKNADGKPYSRIIPTLAGAISKEEGQVIQHLYTKPLADVIKKIMPVRSDYEQTGGDE